jgi:HAD superfamily hydrolase (TIGR01459 family)
MKTPPVYNGLADLVNHYDHFIVDVWGVLHDGQKAYPGAIDGMEYLKKRGKNVLLLSNSPNRSARVVEKVLTPIGIHPKNYDYILTSGEAAHDYMRQHHSGQRVYTFWDAEMPTALDNLDVKRVFDIKQADFMFGSLMPYESVAETYSAVLAEGFARRLPFICANPDRVVGHGDSLHLCVGSLAEAYEKMGGIVVWVGKPYLPVYDRAWEMLGKPDKSKIIAIGDGLITDVGGASTFGCDVIWNVMGIHWDEISTNNMIDREKIAHVLKDQPRPTGLMHGFKV